MAFETFLTVDSRKPKKGRRLMYALSGASHVGLLVVGVAASYARVEEVAPKAVPVTIYTTLATPAPPPPAGGKPPKVITRPTRVPVQPPTTKLVQPPAPHKAEPEEEQEPDGGGPGIKGGTISGTGTADAPADPPQQFLPPNVGRGQLAIDPQADRYRAHLSPLIQRSGMALSALLKVCVDRDGNVVDVKMLTKVSDEIDAAFISAIRTWRYKPYMVGTHTVPFCTSVRYQVATGS